MLSCRFCDSIQTYTYLCVLKMGIITHNPVLIHLLMMDILINSLQHFMLRFQKEQKIVLCTLSFYSAAQKFEIGMIINVFCSSRLYLFDQKYRKKLLFCEILLLFKITVFYFNIL